jgi:WD40 repeat protein
MLHERSVYAAHFSPDGKWVLTCSEEGTAQVWDASNGQPISQPMRHKDKLKNGEFSPDGRLVFTGSEDGIARLWDAQTGYALSEPLVHAGEITCVQFSADGRRSLSIAGSDALRLWDVVNVPVPVPSWFCDLVDAIAGRHLKADRDFEAVSREAIEPLRETFAKVDQKEFYSRWAHWFFVERSKEPAPSFKPEGP